MTALSVSTRPVLGALALALVSAPLAAQQQAKVQLAFGYQCDSKFALKNDGSAAVTVEYAVAGTNERGKVSVKPNETVELESVTNNDVQLYVDGKLVATERKGNRACAPANAAGSVTVRHLDPTEMVIVEQPVVERPVYVEPVYVTPRRVVYVRPWDDYYYRGYYGPSVRVNVGFPFFGGYSRITVPVRHRDGPPHGGPPRGGHRR